MIKLYGIQNCDSVKKAQKLLTNKGVEFEFIDFRKDGLSVKTLQEFIDKVGLEKLINKRSTTYRNLADKENITFAVILENLTLIKRPVLEIGNKTIVGFNESEYQKI